MWSGVLPDAEVGELRTLCKVLQATSHLHCSDRGQPPLWVDLGQGSCTLRAKMSRGPEDRSLHPRWGRVVGWLRFSSASCIPVGVISSILLQVEERGGKMLEKRQYPETLWNTRAHVPAFIKQPLLCGLALRSQAE